MSYIRFQDMHSSAALQGSERAWLHRLARDTADHTLESRVQTSDVGVLYEMLPQGHYLRFRPPPSEGEISLWLWEYSQSLHSIVDEPIVEYRGHGIGARALTLNTAMAAGGDAVKLAARIHYQCELNCWVAGSCRAWLADVIEEGMSSGVYHRGLGWEGIVALLLERDDLPVVISPMESFPSPWGVLAGDVAKTGSVLENIAETWDGLSDREKWDYGLRALYARSEEGLELHPNWGAFRFEHGVSFLDILDEDREVVLDRVLGLAPRH